jgi:hypothetical protein
MIVKSPLAMHVCSYVLDLCLWCHQIADVRTSDDSRLTEPLATQIANIWNGGADGGKAARELQDDCVRKGESKLDNMDLWFPRVSEIARSDYCPTIADCVRVRNPAPKSGLEETAFQWHDQPFRFLEVSVRYIVRFVL